MTRWSEAPGARSGADYAVRWERMAAAGADVHGEADFCSQIVAPGSTVLDAGCGTGRVAIRLAELGYICTGVDVDEAMIAHARATAPELSWVQADLAGPDLPPGPFDLVVTAGNVMPLLAPGTEAGVIAALADRTSVLVAGFGLDAAHLPLPQAPFDLAQYDRWCTAAGLTLAGRYATWAADPYDGSGYAVSIHVTSATPADFRPPTRR